MIYQEQLKLWGDIMNLKALFVYSIALVLIVSQILIAQTFIVPTGSSDDSDLIQTTLDGLQDGDTLRLMVIL